MKTFVLDTSVLLSDPGAMARFAEHEDPTGGGDRQLEAQKGA